MGIGLPVQQAQHGPQAAGRHADAVDDRRVAVPALGLRTFIQLLHPGLEGPMEQDCELDTMHMEILVPIGCF